MSAARKAPPVGLRIALVRPPSLHSIERSVPGAVRRENVSYPPLSLVALGTWLQRSSKHRVRVVDGLADGLDHDALAARIRDARPDVVGITAYTVTLVDVLEAVKAARRAGARWVVLGGPHVNDFPREAARLPGIDAVVVGEGQVPFTRMCDVLFRDGRMEDCAGIPGVRLAGDEGPAVEAPFHSDDLDDYPALDWTLVRYDRYYDVMGRGGRFTTALTSRGCPFRCNFCNTPRVKWRTQSAARVCDDVVQALNLGISEVYFVDDTFNITGRRVSDLCEEILRRRIDFRWTVRCRAKGVSPDLARLMRRAGCQRVQFGVESGSDEALEWLDKGVTVRDVEEAFAHARAAGLETAGYFMIGLPTETDRQAVIRGIDYAVSLRPDYGMFNILTPFPGTRLYQKGVEMGVVREAPWRAFLEAPDPSFRPQVWDQHLAAEELEDLLRLAWRRFYARPDVVWNTVRRTSNPAHLARKARAGLGLLLSR